MKDITKVYLAPNEENQTRQNSVIRQILENLSASSGSGAAGAAATITSSGTFTLGGATIGDILVNVAGLVTIQLPLAANRTAGSVTISEIGGHSQSFPISILPSSSDLIAGQASLKINVNYGTITIAPITSGWYFR